MNTKTVRTAVAAIIVALGAASASYAQSPSEEQTSRNVLAQLNHDVALRSDTLHVETEGNTVYISGQVADSLESQDAVELARSVPNVAKVIDRTYSTSGN